MVMPGWPMGQGLGPGAMDWSQWQTPGTGAPNWYYDMNGALRYQPVNGSARVVGEGGPELEQNYIDPITGRLVVNVMPMAQGQGQNPIQERFQNFRQQVQERFPQAQQLRERFQGMMTPPAAGSQPPAEAPPAAQRTSWFDRMRRPMLPGGEEGPQLQGNRGGPFRFFFPQGAAGPAVPGMQQGGQLTAPLPSYITNLFSGNPQGIISALGGLFGGAFQNGQFPGFPAGGGGGGTGGGGGGGAGTQPPAGGGGGGTGGSAPPAPSGVWPPPEPFGTINVNRYSPQDLGQQPFIQTLRGTPRPAFQGFGAELSNPDIGVENMPLLNLQRYYELAPSEQAQAESLYGQGLKLDFRDLLEAAYRASPQAMERRPSFYGS